MSHAPLSIALLGPVAVARGGRPVAGLADRERAVLAVLALRDGPVARGALCGLLWPDAPEARARQSLRVALARLRAALPGRIAADRAGVAFIPAPGDEVDVRAVRPVLDAAATAGGIAPSPEALRAALARVRGPLADGLDRAGSPAFRAWLAGEREAWEARVARARAHLAEAGAGGDEPSGRVAPPANRPAEAADPIGRGAGPPAEPTQAAAERIALLRAAAHAAPLDEDLARRLIQALGRAAAFDEALAEHDRLVAALDGALGLAPEPATEALRARVAAARARRRHNVPPEPDGADRGARDAATWPDERAARLAAWLADPARRLITVVGPPGTGRARAAGSAALASLGAFLDGVAWVAGPSPATPSAPLAERVARALADLDGEAVAPNGIAAHLAPLERLLVLDGIDGPAAPEAAAVAAWLEAAPGLRCLVVATAPLGVFFEHRFAAGA